MERDSAVFYRSFYEASKDLPGEVQTDIYKAMFEYAFYKNEIDLEGTAKAIFTLIKPQLDANIRKFENGKNGGRPPKDKNQKETKSKPKNNQKETKSKGNENVSDNVSSNVNSNDDANGNGEILIDEAAKQFYLKEDLKKVFMKDYKISEENELWKHLQNFNNHLRKKEIKEKAFHDYRDHFGHWLKIQIEKKKNINTLSSKQDRITSEKEKEVKQFYDNIPIE